MYEEIYALEVELDSLLPVTRLQETGISETLLSAANKWSDSVWKKAEELGELNFTEKEIQQALRFSKQPVFICGAHRSGTTLLRDMLDDHPSLSVLPSEGSFITNQQKQLLLLPDNLRCSFLCREWLRRLANPINQPPYWLLGRSSKEQSPYVDFAKAFITWWNFFVDKERTKNTFWPLIVLQLAYAFCNKSGGYSTLKYWVDKTPGNERYLAELWEQFPEAKIIQVLRNPIAILASRKQIEPFTPLRIFISEIRMSFKVAAKQESKKNVRHLIIRYENICNDPTLTAQNMASFLGIQLLPCLIHPTVAGKPTKANSSFKADSEQGKILSAEEHRQGEIITAKELKLLSAAVSSTAIKFGYTLPFIGTLKAFFLRIINRVK